MDKLIAHAGVKELRKDYESVASELRHRATYPRIRRRPEHPCTGNAPSRPTHCDDFVEQVIRRSSAEPEHPDHGHVRGLGDARTTDPAADPTPGRWHFGQRRLVDVLARHTQNRTDTRAKVADDHHSKDIRSGWS
jgi:hypothetical protein